VEGIAVNKTDQVSALEGLVFTLLVMRERGHK